MNVPKRGIGPASLQKIMAFSREMGIKPVEALERVAEIPGLSTKVKANGAALGALLRKLSEEASSLTVTELTRAILERTGYRQELLNENTVESRTRLENLDEFISSTVEFDRRDEEKGLGSFLENVALVADVDRFDGEADQVVLMTLHSAKGLEFPVVFLVGMEESVFPHARSLLDPGELEEERRLCYVGVTRAREKLYLAHCWKRTLYGIERYNKPSRFFEEIPSHLVNPWNPAAEQEHRAEGVTPGNNSGPRSGAVDQFILGDKIQHHKWGVGVIVGVKGKGEDAEYKVAFPEEGIKVLLARYARLERFAGP
ncbi:MAG: ATP-dependent DNA helicase PcrA [Firmicutes bacterium ADurb.Bin456]|nr:MAG: ATP-dependent DNA helicase PcrA [Firmicutes bacterium ADurb.Bin456]